MKIVEPSTHVADPLTAIKACISAKANDFGLCNGGDPQLLAWAAEPREWFKGLPSTAIRGNVPFVHAGARPGVPLEDQATDALIRIRQPFLSTLHELS